MREPLVSILMPVYNAEKYVTKALESVLAQSYGNIEVLVVDDASTDNTKSILDSIRDNRIKYYTNEKNHGYLKSCNLLFKQARGKYITFQDADDISEPHRIAMLVEKIKSASVDICGSNVNYIDKNGKIIGRSSYPCSDADIKKRLIDNSYFPFCGSSVMIKSEILNSIGYYREFFDRIGNEDIDWIFRIASHCAVANVPDYLYSYRRDIGSISNAPLDLNPLKLCAGDIARSLYLERLEKGVDCLDAGDKTGFNSLKDSYLRRIEENPYIMMSKLLNIYLSNKSYKLFFRTMNKFLLANLTDVRCYLSALLFMTRFVTGEHIYGMIRNSIFVQKLSRSMLE